MFKMRLVTNNTKSGRLLKYKSIEGARKALKRIMGTDSPRKDLNGYAVGDKGQCLFFLEGLTYEMVFPQVIPVKPGDTLRQDSSGIEFRVLEVSSTKGHRICCPTRPGSTPRVTPKDGHYADSAGETYTVLSADPKQA